MRTLPAVLLATTALTVGTARAQSADSTIRTVFGCVNTRTGARVMCAAQSATDSALGDLSAMVLAGAGIDALKTTMGQQAGQISVNSNRILAEANRAQASEALLAPLGGTVAFATISGDGSALSVAPNMTAQQLVAQVASQQTMAQTNASAISAEAGRAQAAEALKAAGADLTAEVSRAKTAEGLAASATALAGEASTARAAEASASSAAAAAASTASAAVPMAGGDASATITIAPGETTNRNSAARLSDVYNLADHGARGDAASDNTALTRGLAYAASHPGTHITLPSGVWAFSVSSRGQFPIPSSTTFEGVGAETVLRWNDDVSKFGFLTSTGTAAAHATNIVVRNLTIQGGWGIGADFAHGTGFPMLLSYVDGLEYVGVHMNNSRSFGLGCIYCSYVSVHDNTVSFSATDAIPVWSSSHVNINHNHVSHTGDDAISAHNAIDDPDGVRRDITITDNDIFDSSSISAGGARNVVIANNNIDTVKSHAVTLFTTPAATSNTQGQTNMDGVLVEGNHISNVLNRAYLDKYAGGNSAIIVIATSARAGSGPSIPGEAASGVAKILDPLPYFLANSQSASVAVAASSNIKITGNFISRTLPQTDGTTSPAFANWVALNQGSITGTDGLYNPSLTLTQLATTGILVTGGYLRGLSITDNQFAHITTGVEFDGAKTGDYSDAQVAGNQFIDLPNGYGVMLNTAGKLALSVRDNLFDMDPYGIGATRGGSGNWNGLGNATAIYFAQAASGVTATGNRFVNSSADTNTNTADPTTGDIWRGNTAYGDMATPYAYAIGSNFGMGQISPGTLLVPTDSKPSDAAYGQPLSAPVQAAAAMPTSGNWIAGAFVENTAPTASAPVRGWLRLTTGSANAAGVDWMPLSLLPGTLAQNSDGTASGGNARGSNATDWQTTRNAAGQVASGSTATIGGGRQNTASGQDSVVPGGAANTASGQGSSASGIASTSSGRASIAYGDNSTASGAASAVFGSWGNDQGNGYSLLLGGGIFSGSGDSQSGIHHLMGSGTGTGPIRLTAQGAAVSPTTCLRLSNGQSINMRIAVEATDVTTRGYDYSWTSPALVTQDGSVTTTAITLGTATVLSRGTVTGAAVSATADTTNGCVNISFSPPTANTTDVWHVVARLDTAEVR